MHRHWKPQSMPQDLETGPNSFLVCLCDCCNHGCKLLFNWEFGLDNAVLAH